MVDVEALEVAPESVQDNGTGTEEAGKGEVEVISGIVVV